jgi:GntR family transcriptional regulator / MocR family aminotransferase
VDGGSAVHRPAVDGSVPVELHVRLDGRLDVGGQVYRQIRLAIVHGRLHAGDMVPSTRELARRLALSRTTVGLAYDRLVADGYLAARTGVGTFVTHGRPPTPDGAAAGSPLRPRPLWDRLYDPPDMSGPRPAFDLRTGIPDVTRLPFATWRSLMADQFRLAAAGRGAHIDAAGHPGLRAAIARHLGASRGIRARADDVLVTNGSQQAVDLAARVLLEPGATVAMEDPGYSPPCASFVSLGARVVGVPVDDEGLVVDALPDDARLVYVTPSHQFPLGTPMSQRRKLALLGWAGRHGAAILEDDYDGEFRHEGRPLEPLHNLDKSGRVLYVGSFSKVLMPTLRLGYLVAPPTLHGALRKAKHVADWHTQVQIQAAAARFVDDGHLRRHVRRMQRVYEERHHLVVDVLATELAEHLTPMPAACGLHVTALLRHGGDDLAVVDRAAERGVGVQALSPFGLGHRGPDGLLIGFGGIATERIREGLLRLREVI